MLRVDGTKPCAIVYALCRHEFLGFLIEPHVVQLNDQGRFSLTHQRLYSNTAKSFADLLDPDDFALIKLLECCDQESLIRNLLGKPLRPSIFFAKYDDDQHLSFRKIIDCKLNEAFKLLPGKNLFEMGKDGNPTWQQLTFTSEPATVLFHFKRGPIGTRYFPTVRYQGRRIEFMFKNASIITNFPAWMLLEGLLYYFEGGMDGKKIQPFLNKRYIEVPAASEHQYFKRFVLPLIEKHSVRAEGFEIIVQRRFPEPKLKISASAFGKNCISLSFKYGKYEFSLNQEAAVSVSLETEDGYRFIKTERRLNWEKEKAEELKEMGLRSSDNSLFFTDRSFARDQPGFPALAWLNDRYQELERRHFLMEKDKRDAYLLGASSIQFSFSESIDWFDIHAEAYLGGHLIPLDQLRNHLLAGLVEFVLPGGEIALIPENWSERFIPLFAHTEPGGNRLKKMHVGLISGLANEQNEGAFSERVRALSGLAAPEVEGLTKSFEGSLRPYQQEGFNWLCFLRKGGLGGCLADDMGLGKTVQTLALLASIKDTSPGVPSLVVMPTSLIHNWMSEAARFTPSLKIAVYTGSERHKMNLPACMADLILTTYGVLRLDESILSSLAFNYVILDESQHIKNSSSKIFKAVRTLRSVGRLILTGTPMENSINDLWSQMSFLNWGLLGSEAFFTEHYYVPIEKKGDLERLSKLQALIRPFILRRTKQQVATELPSKNEQIFFSDMTADQQLIYDRIKFIYRSKLLESSPEGGLRNRFSILQGLTRLRQVANHPVLEKSDYSGESGKFNDVIELLTNALLEGHKILIFSSFTSHLALFKNYLENKDIPFAYLDGATQKREEEVVRFRSDNIVNVFLISIRAGGTGLNLVEADYVFILDPWWNPAVERQATDRAHRIGQTKSVFIYKFISKNSVEEKILSLQERKKNVSDVLIQSDGALPRQLSWADLQTVLE